MFEAGGSSESYSEETESHNDSSELKEHKYTTLDSVLADEVTLKLREYPNTTVFGVGDYVLEGDYNSFKTVIPKEMLTSKMLEFFNYSGYIPAED